ncbi:MAG TPA: hypothetical protein VGH16_00890 [Candidatus Binatia bacterium]|jgi:hypothetical protein
MRTICFAASLLLLTSCGSFSGTFSGLFNKAPAKEVSDAKTIGAISLLGDKVNVAPDKDEPADLGLDRFVVEQLQTSLAGKTKLRFVKVNYKYADFEPIYRAMTRTPYADYDLGEAREAFSRLKKTPGVDLLILVAKARRDMGGGQFVRGAAVTNRSSLLGRSGPVAVLAVNVALVDMNDLKILSTVEINQQQELDKAPPKENLKSAPPEQLKFLEVFYKSALVTELDRAVKEFRLPAAEKK